LTSRSNNRLTPPVREYPRAVAGPQNRVAHPRVRDVAHQHMPVGMLQRCPRTRRIGKVDRYIITIQAASFEDVENVELPAPPQPGEPIETHLGTCIVTSMESMPAESGYAGRIICRLP
jgi:hypothetical protein